MTREGFIDGDEALDDLSSIAATQVILALRQLPEVEVGPVRVGNFRAARAEVSLSPVAGGVEVELMLHRALMDMETRRLGPIQNIPILRAGLRARLTARADARGRPQVALVDVEPDIELVERTEGALNWILYHTAAIVEAVAEAMSREPIQAAVTDALDGLLQRWISEIEIDTVPPLSPETLRIAYRFASIDLTESGLTATMDVRVGCPDEPSAGVGRLVRHRSGTRGPPGSELGNPVAWASLSADAVNGVLHALWRCGALDTVVDFTASQAEIPLLVPGAIATRFGLPPVLQADRGGRMTIGVGGVVAEAHYVDVAYEVGATGLIPIFLEANDDGRALSVGFDAEPERLELYTDCLRTGERICRDNPLFDRLAWLAVPYLPPIGATLPLPDLRLSDDPAHRLHVRLDTIAFNADQGRIDVLASYRLER